jgi:hypothetical protein
MKNKLIGIFSCMLLITTIVLPVSGSHTEKLDSSKDGIEMVPVLDFMGIKGGFLSLLVHLENSGEGPAYNVYWEMRPSGGFFFYPKIDSGEIPIIGPGEQVDIKINPAIGLGEITIEFYCRYLTEGMYCETELEVKQEWRNRALLIVNTFPESIQPEKEWMIIENYSYQFADEPGVMLMYLDINNMHNLRVVSSSDSSTQKVEFRAACCFDDGIGHLKECWITREIVESGIGQWEVELVDGE